MACVQEVEDKGDAVEKAKAAAAVAKQSAFEALQEGRRCACCLLSGS